MNIPESTNKKWEEAIIDNREYKFKFLATKIILGRLRLCYNNNATPEQIKTCASELRTFFEKNKNIPVAIEDLKEIVGG
jgi:hypothetical protein